MARVYLFITAMIMIPIMFMVFGNYSETNTGILNNFGISYDSDTGLEWDGIQGSNFWNIMFGATGAFIVLVLSGSLVIGFLTKSNPENYVMLGVITGTLILYVTAFDGLIGFFANQEPWIQVSAMSMLILLSLGYIITMIEFFRGNV